MNKLKCIVPLKYAKLRILATFTSVFEIFVSTHLLQVRFISFTWLMPIAYTNVVQKKPHASCKQPRDVKNASCQLHTLIWGNNKTPYDNFIHPYDLKKTLYVNCIHPCDVKNALCQLHTAKWCKKCLTSIAHTHASKKKYIMSILQYTSVK